MLETYRTQKFLIVSIIPHNLSEREAYENVYELISLVETYKGVVADILLQKREVHDKGLYIGKGKIEEVGEIIQGKGIDVVILNAIVKPGDLYYFQTLFSKVNPKIQVWDRVDLILNIFSKQANTSEAKLQIELAALKHMGPRIYGMGLEMSRQGGRIGTLGVGETNTELMRRHFRDQMKKTQEKLKKLTQTREQQMKNRKETGIKTVSIIGYTNAGKTSLFNLLTGKKKLVKDALFATLDSVSGKIYLPELKEEVLITDTIGFIKDLPPELIEAFKSTLMESLHSDLLLNVIDLSDPDMERKIQVVEGILKDLEINDKKRIYVFNKTDLANGIDENEITQKYSEFDPLFISVFKDQGVNKLLDSITQQMYFSP